MRLEELIKEFESICPQDWVYPGDEVGLFCGDPKRAVDKVLIALDISDEVINEAIEGRYDLLFTHHPLRNLNGARIIATDSLSGKIYRAIQNDLAIYSAHTNLDFAPFGVSVALAGILGIKIDRPLSTKNSGKLYKIAVFVPETNFERFRRQMLDLGIGSIGKYSRCSFSSAGEGTFEPGKGTNPYIGEIGKLEKVDEIKFETIVPSHLLNETIRSMKTFHPYEEPAYDIYPLENVKSNGGFGLIGTLAKMMSVSDVARLCMDKLPTDAVRISGDGEKFIRKVAVLGGSGDSFVRYVIDSAVDLFIVGELNYHSALALKEAEIASVVAGHFGTEWIILPTIRDILLKFFDKYGKHGEVKISDVEEPIFKTVDN
ncbi:Nif3-like dinuclear metal center hexameric protein [bacterium]|nr:Nif3-like dinuclear metal center hexameric protein [bacterium]